MDLNHRSPASKAGRDDQAPLHADLTGAHGRTRTCTSPVRNRELCPIELRVRDWCRDGDSNSGLPAENRHVLATRRARQTGSPTRTRTWIDRLTAGRPTVGRSGNGGAPRTRTELNLLAREIRGPCACPDWSCVGGQTLVLPRATERWRDGSDPHGWGDGAWGRFRAHLSAASTRRFHQISFPGGIERGAADRNRTRVCAVVPLGSAIELRTPELSGVVHRAGLEPAKPEGTWFTAKPRCRLSICARELDAGDPCDRPHPCWRKADGSNATPCGAHPFSRRVAGHSSGAFPCWTSRRDLNARPPPSGGGALIH